MTDQQDARHLLERAERAATAGDLVSADELLRDAARIQEEELGPHHPDLANTLNNLAIVAEKTGRPDEAETFYRRAAAIAAAALPAAHPMRVESRQNLEDFCRARGLPVDTPAAIMATRDTEVNAFASEKAETDQIPVRREATAPKPTPGKASYLMPWVAAGAVVLVAALLLFLRPWSFRDASSETSPPVPAPAQPVVAVPRQVTPPPTKPAPIEQPAPAAPATPRDDRKVSANKAPAAAGVAVTAQLCRTFSTSGSNWRCDPAGDTVAPGRMVFYTRIRSPRHTEVVHRWYRGSTLRQSVTLNIQASATEGYRTYSRLTVDKGDWRLEVRSADGDLLHEQRFAVQ